MTLNRILLLVVITSCLVWLEFYINIIHAYVKINTQFHWISRSQGSIVSIRLLHAHNGQSHSNPLISYDNSFQQKRLRSKDINTKIMDVFNQQHISDIDIARLQKFLLDNSESLNQVNALTLLHRCGKKRISILRCIQEDKLLSLLETKQEFASISHIANALYGLQSLPVNSEIIFQIIEKLYRHVEGNFIDKQTNELKALCFGMLSLKQTSLADSRLLQFLDLWIDCISNSLDSGSTVTLSDLELLSSGIQSFSSSEFPCFSKFAVIIRKMIKLYNAILPSETISKILFGLRSSDSRCFELSQVLEAICDNIELYNYACFELITAKDISMQLCGLQGMDSSCSSVERLVRIFTKGIDRRLNSESHALYIQSGRELSPLLVGMSSFSSNHPFVREWQALILRLIHIPESNNSPREYELEVDSVSMNQLSSCYFGLKSATSDSIEAMQLLSILNKILASKTQLFTPKQLANAMYGLQRMSATHSEVQLSLRLFLSHLNSLQGDKVFGVNEVAMLCYGLQSMSPCQSKVVDALLHSLSTNIQYIDQSFSTSQVAMTLFGMKTMSSNYTSVIRMFSSVTSKWNPSSNMQKHEIIQSKDLAMIMNGIRGLSNENIAIESFLSKLIFLFQKFQKQSNTHLSLSQFATILNGFQSMGSMAYVKNSYNKSHNNDTLSALPFTSVLSTINTQELNASSFLGFGILYQNNQRKFRISNKLLTLLGIIYDLLIEKKDESMTIVNIASSLFGLQGLSSDSLVVRKFLMTFANDLKQSILKGDVDMDSKAIASSLYGMQHMNSKYEEVQAMLDVICLGLQQSSKFINAQAIGNGLYGLQSMSDDYIHVRQVLAALNEKIKNMPHPIENPVFEEQYEKYQEFYMSGQNIGNALWGLRNMTSSHSEVRQVLSSLAKKIRESNAIMNGQNIGNSLYALHAMDDSYDEVREILSSLAYKIVISDKQLSSLDIGMALFGLKNKDHESPEVRVILGALIHKIRNSSMKLELQDLSLAIVGILNSASWIREDFLNVLATKSGINYMQDL